MTVTYHAGRRIQGLDSDRTATQLPSGSVGGWVELGRHTLTSNSGTLDVSNLADKKYLMIIYNRLGNTGTGTNALLRFNNDSTAGNYYGRESINGGTDGVRQTNETSFYYFPNHSSGNDNGFAVSFFANKSGEDKLGISWQVVDDVGSGAGSVQDRAEFVYKWQSTDVIDQVTVFNATNSFTTGSELIVLGFDPSDTHTTNFWEELVNITPSSPTDNLNSGTFTAKKYLMFSLYCDANVSGAPFMAFNGTGGSAQYNRRREYDNTSEYTNGLESYFYPYATGQAYPKYVFGFIVNNQNNEKFLICWTNESTSGVPSRIEFTGKWANTTNQITSIEVGGAPNYYGTNANFTVWGAD